MTYGKTEVNLSSMLPRRFSMGETITENAIKQAYSVTIMQLFNVYLNSANDPNASARFQEGLHLAIQVRDACMQIASQNHAP